MIHVRHLHCAARSLGVCIVASQLSAAAAPCQVQHVEFADLEKQFASRVAESLGVDPAAETTDVQLFIARSLLASAITETINRGNTTVAVELTALPTFVPEPFDLRTAKHRDADRNCSRDEFCNWGCDDPWTKIFCEAEKELCKDGQKLDCERLKAIGQSVSEKKIAVVSFKWATIDKAGGTASNLTANVAPDLGSLVLTTNLTADAMLSCSGYIAPEPLIYAFGCVKHEFSFKGEPIEVRESQFELKGTVELKPTVDGIEVSGAVELPSVVLHFAGTPVLRYIARNPLSFLACPVAYSIGAIADLVAPNDMAKARVALPDPGGARKLGTVSFAAGDLAMATTPRVSPQAIGLSGVVTP